MASNAPLRLISSNLKKCSLAAPRSTFGTRNVHQRRALLYPIENGVGNFLPPQALQTSIDWQDGLLERLNEEVKGTPDEHKSIVQTVINSSAHRETTLAFNYSSLALNNSYFLDNIKPPPAHEDNHESEISSELLLALNEQHGSIRQLKSSFSAAALGMFSNGWVWFVSDSSGETGILPTFGTGTLLVRSRSYMGTERGLDLGDAYNTPTSSPTSKSPLPGVTPSSPTSGLSSPAPTRPPNDSGARFLHTRYANGNEWATANKATLYKHAWNSDLEVRSLPTVLNVGEVLYPLFCVPVYEHAWMSAGFGVWGKEKWLTEFWNVVDWAKVSKSYRHAKDSKSFLEGKS